MVKVPASPPPEEWGASADFLATTQTTLPLRKPPKVTFGQRPMSNAEPSRRGRLGYGNCEASNPWLPRGLGSMLGCAESPRTEAANCNSTQIRTAGRPTTLEAVGRKP